jgi:hypothetical protein
MDGDGLRPRNDGKGGRNPESTHFMGIEVLVAGYSVVRYRFGGGVTGDKPLAGLCRVFCIMRNAYMHKKESGHAEENDDHHG